MAKFLGLRGSRLTSAISAICGLCFLCYGYAQGVMGGLLTVPAFLERFPQLDITDNVNYHDAWVTGLTVGTWNLGCVVSAILAVFISDRLGRRRTLLLGITLWTVGEIIQTSSYSFAQFIIGRAIAGFGNGFTTATAPAYQAECVKSHRKGTILMISAGAFVSAGYALSYWLTFACAYSDNGDATWRVPIALQITFALPAIPMLAFWMPDSPRWLILTGREKEALATIAALNDDEPDSFEVREEFLQIKDAILVMAQGSSANMFSNRDRRGFHRVALAYMIQVFQQGTGINLVLQYLSWIFFTRMGYSGWLSRLLASFSATTYFLSSFITVVGIDRFWGRRSLMMFGASGMSGCMILITITQYLWQMHSVNAGRVAGTVFLFAFSMFFAVGWQGMAWLYQVEIVPLRIRGPANALSTKGNWVFNFIIVFITPIAFMNIGYRTWIIFACTNFAIVPLIYFFYPETAFRSLEEVDVIFFLADEQPGNPWLNAVKISLNEPLWFGKRGEDTGFQYSNSTWHKRFIDSSGSGSGSNSGSNEKRRRTGKGSESDSSGQESSGSDTVVPAQPHMLEKSSRSGSESPIDPQMHSYNEHSPDSTLTTTITSHKNDSRRSLRDVLTRSRSSEQRSSQAAREFAAADEQQRIQSMQSHYPESPEEKLGVGRFSPDADPEWWDTELAPQPLRVSRPPSEEQRPYSSESGAHRHASDASIGRPGTASSRQSYTGRAKSDGFDQPGRVDVVEDGERPGLRSRGSERSARGAGRAF